MATNWRCALATHWKVAGAVLGTERVGRAERRNEGRRVHSTNRKAMGDGAENIGGVQGGVQERGNGGAFYP